MNVVFKIDQLYFRFLLFCLPHPELKSGQAKKVTKKVTTGHSMLYKALNVDFFIKKRILHTPVDNHPLMPFLEKNYNRESRFYFLFSLWQDLAVSVGCPQIVRNTVCTALVSVGLCDKDRQDFLSVEGFFFLFGRCQKENE